MLSTVVTVLAVAVGLHLLLTFSLIARVRTLQDMLAGTRGLPQPGTPVGSFEAATPEGEKLTDALLRGGTTLVGFFAPGCGPCEKARTELVASPPGLPVLAFVDGTDADPDARTLVASLGQVARVAYAASGDDVYRAFRPVGFPSLFRIENGQVAAAGHRLGDVLL